MLYSYKYIIVATAASYILYEYICHYAFGEMIFDSSSRTINTAVFHLPEQTETVKDSNM